MAESRAERRFPVWPVPQLVETTMPDRIVFFRRNLLCGLTLAALLLGPAPAFAAANLTISPITWNIIGLDSNNVSVGPNHFPVGARVCNTGDAPATNVTSALFWDSANMYIDRRPGTLMDFDASPVASLDPTKCHDFYYEVEVKRDPAAYDTTRRYHITATATGLGTVSTPTPRELYVEHLVSQSRNHVTGVDFREELAPAFTNVPNGGTMTLLVGRTYEIKLTGSTATNGYEQIESFINLPNTIFQVLSVKTTYTADTSAYVNGLGDDKLYGDACKWENDPNSPYYRSCRDVGKAGGGVVVTYKVKILQVPSSPLVNPEPLSTLIFDFSGSSYHYNDDFCTSVRYAVIPDPTIAKSFSPNPTYVNGISALTFTITNPHPVALSGLSFSDVFPTSPGAMVVASSPGATINGCGSPTFAPVAGAGSISFSNGTVAANSSCTVTVNVTVPTAGTYNNTSDHLFIDGIDTGHFATGTLTAGNTPAPVETCGLPLASWNFPDKFDPMLPAPSSNTVSAIARPGAGIKTNSAQGSQDHTVTPAGTFSWLSNGGFDNTGDLTTFDDYFEFEIDTTGLSKVELTFWALRTNNGPEKVVVYSSKDGTIPGTLHTTTLSLPNANTWVSPGTLIFNSSDLNPSGKTYFRIYGAFAKLPNPGADLSLDDVSFTRCAVLQPPTISKGFFPDPVAVDSTSTLTFTITNPNAGAALSGVAFDDTLPTGVTVTSYNSSQCGGTLSFTGGKLSLIDGTLAPGASCTVTATVMVTTAGSHNNVSDAVSSKEGGKNTGLTGFATASITGILPPTIAKQFAPNPVLAGTATTLTFTLTNPNTSVGLTGVAFSDTFPVAPGAMVVAPSPGASTSGCGSPTFTPAAGSGSINFSNGSIAPGGTCIVKVDVVAPVAGSYANTSGPVSHIFNGVPVSGNTASDTLTANPATPVIALLKQVGPTASGPWSSFLATPEGGNVFYRFTVENIGNVPLNSVGVNDLQVSTASCIWPSPLPVASPTEDPAATCIVGPVAALSGSRTNTATASGTNGGTTVTDTSIATYGTTGLTLAKSVTETSFTAAGEVLHYSFLVTNSGFAALAGPVIVSDDKTSDESCPAVSTVGDFDNFLDPGESVTCTATYTVTASDVAAGFVTNQASATADGVTSNTDTETVTPPVNPPIIAKSFSPNSVAVGGVSVLTITITNPNAGAALTGVSFTDTFPAGLEVAVPASPSATNCGGPLALGFTALSTSLSVTGATIAASDTCTFKVRVKATTAGAKVNTTSSVTSTNGGTGSPGTATLNAVSPPVIAKSFSPNPIGVGGTSMLTFTITNSNTGTSLTGVAFTDTFPAGLEVAAAPNASTSGCGSPAFSPVAGNTSLSFSGGTIAQSGTCTVSVSVTATTTGAKVNTTSSVTSTNGGTGNTGTDTLTVALPPSIAKSFSPNSIAVGGVSTLTFTITNPDSGMSLTGVAVTDTFPAGLQVAATPNATITGCGSPAFAPAAGNTSVSFTGGTIAASGTCTVTVDVTATTAGAKVNTTGNVTSSNGGTGNTGTATLTVNQTTAPLVTAIKSSSFVAATNDLDGNGLLSPGDTLRYTIVVSNTGNADALAVVLTDTPGTHSTLVAGTVTTTQGTVTQGNQAGATSVTVDLGTLVATTGQATVSFTIKLDSVFPVGVTTILNQATIRGSNFSDVLSDNPTTTPPGDPTVDVVAVGVPAIPTLSEWGALLLALLLAAAAAWRLRTGRRTIHDS